ncbi:MAG: alpha/beta hydrolase [Tepidisphaerales bacterium]
MPSHRRVIARSAVRVALSCVALTTLLFPDARPGWAQAPSADPTPPATTPASAAATSPAGEAAEQAPRHGTVVGDLRLHPDFPSAVLGNRRTLRVWVPPGYDDPANAHVRYPVIYAHDGQGLFDRTTAAFGEEWQLDEAMTELLPRGEVAAAIIVGIDNSPDRVAEYTSDTNGDAGGKGADYARFLVEEVKPFIDATYRTRPEREHTITLGSSLGGLISLYLLRAHGDVFGGVAIVSPSLWWADEAELKRWEAAAEPGGVADEMPGRRWRVWLDMGTREGAEDRWALHSARARRLHAALQRRPELHVHFLEVEGGRHTAGDWAQRVPQIFKFLLNPADMAP